MKEVWKMESALEFIRKVQPEALINGYALSLGGSLLNTGFSWKDMDLVALPSTNEHQNEENLVKAFEGFEVQDTLTSYPGIKVFKMFNGKLRLDLTIPLIDNNPNNINKFDVGVSAPAPVRDYVGFEL